MTATIALLAHDGQKDDLVAFVRHHRIVFARYRLIATATTGKRLQEAIELDIQNYASGPDGGDVQIAAEVVGGDVRAVFFWLDPRYAQSQEPEIQSLLRVCNLHNVPLATNLATAELVIDGLARLRVAHLIFNPVAGQGDGESELALIKDLLNPHFNLQVHLTQPDQDAATLTQAALASGTDLVIVSGGDGTVSAVAGQLLHRNVPLGIIPRGTANAFCAALGISSAVMPLRTACRIILEGVPRQVDAACCNGRVMILLAGIGFEAETVAKASRDYKDQWGALAYVMAGWSQLDEQELFQAELEVDGEIFPMEAGAITVANAAPPTSVLAQGVGEVCFDDGLLDVTIATAETKFQAVTAMLSTLGAALMRTEANHPNVSHLRTRQVRIRAEPAQKVVIDGEIVGTTPVEITCLPQALMVMMPRS